MVAAAASAPSPSSSITRHWPEVTVSGAVGITSLRFNVIHTVTPNQASTGSTAATSEPVSR